MKDDSTSLQREHMQRVTDWAGQARDVLEPIALRRAGDVHFRPGSAGVTMVGLQPRRPQRGRSGFRDLHRLSATFDECYTRHCVAVEQGRPTPEKQLQSWILADAYQHGRRMNAVESALGDGTALWFVTDELVLPLPKKRRMVCDILALRTGPQGRCRPVVVELKAAREMKRLIAQVQQYAACVSTLSEPFESLYSAVLGRNVVFSGPPERWIVWPQAGAVSDPREDVLAQQGIRIANHRARAGTLLI